MSKTAAKTMFEEADRLKAIPPYATAQLEVLRQQAEAKGMKVIDLGIGSPDLPTPEPVVEAGVKALRNPANHGYPTFKGKKEFREAIARWYQRHYGVQLDPETEVLPLIGSKEGLAKLALAFINPGDKTIVPQPAYPVHTRGTILAGGEIVEVPCLPHHDFLPDWNTVHPEDAEAAKLLFFNFPSNPTAAVAPRSFYEDTVEFAKRNGIMLVHDLAYSEIAFDGYKPTSLLEIPGAKDIGIEFHTMSKTYSMAGWRVGFVVGNAKMIHALYRIKTNMDYGVPNHIQDAAIAALDLPQSYIDSVVEIYRERRDVMVDGLNSLGWNVEKPKAAMYVWAPVPKGQVAFDWVADVIDRAGVVFTPGTGFGAMGQGYFRISLVRPVEVLKEVVERLRAAGIRYEA